MKALAEYKDFTVEPLGGQFDARSPSGQIGFAGFRVSLNMDTSDEKKCRRLGGWRKLMWDAPEGFRNQDFHDQLVDCQYYYGSYSTDVYYGPQLVDGRFGETWPYFPYYGYGPIIPVYSDPYYLTIDGCTDDLYRQAGCRESVTGLFEFISSGGRRRLIASTKSRIALLDPRHGNWRLLADRLGGGWRSSECDCLGSRFKMAQMGDTMLFTDRVGPVLGWRFDDGPSGCDLWSASPVEDLLSDGITGAGVVAAWSGFCFIGDVVVSGTPCPNRIYWSDFNSPLSWSPGAESLASFVDLGIGERIQAIVPLGGQLRVYATRGDEKAIYNVALVGGEQVLNFQEIYRGPDGVEFDNSVVNCGQAHYWLGRSGIYWLGEYDRVPVRVEWMHKASAVFYQGMQDNWLADFPGLSGFSGYNKERCENVVGGYDSVRKAVWFSWPTGNVDCPNMSLRYSVQYGGASIVDHGFTGFCNFRPDSGWSVRDLVWIYGGCDIGGPEKEGYPLLPAPSVTPATWLWNPTEDPDLPVDPDSFAYRMLDKLLSDFCGTCESDALFVMADGEDKTLKQFESSTYFRERYVDSGATEPCPMTVSGDWVQDGYYSMLQGDAFNYKSGLEKLIRLVKVEFESNPQTTPNLLTCHVGYGDQPGCMLWDTAATPVPLECLTASTESQHRANNTRPNTTPKFNFHRRGIYLAWRFYIDGTGGGATFNSVTLNLRPKADHW